MDNQKLHNCLEDEPQPQAQSGSPPPLSLLIIRLRDILKKILKDQPVSLAYLFGSVATGQSTSFSDVDIAILVNEPLSPLERLRLILRVQQQLCEAIDFTNVDVRIVNDAPLVFQGRVVSDGILVYTRDEQKRVEFETHTRLHYFDYLPVHTQIQEAFFADLRERGLYGGSG